MGKSQDQELDIAIQWGKKSDEGTWAVTRPQSGRHKRWATQTWLGVREVLSEKKKLKLKPEVLGNFYGFSHPTLSPLGKLLTEMISFTTWNHPWLHLPSIKGWLKQKITVTMWLNWTWWSKSHMAHWLHIFTTYWLIAAICSVCSMPLAICRMCIRRVLILCYV